MLQLLAILPLCGALAAWLVRDNRRRALVLPAVALPHTLLSLVAVAMAPAMASAGGGWLVLDPLGKIVLLSNSLLFLACSWYAVGYLEYRQERSNRELCMGLLVCLSAMSLSAVAHHLGLLWVAVEATTITMAPLIYFNRNARSIEATWKYLLIGSVGIALALFGLFMLAYSTLVVSADASLELDYLIRVAPRLDSQWLHAASIFLLVGYGTKLGLAPLHTWKPDAYGEAPGLVGALLAGGLANCAVLAILRVYQVVSAAGSEAHSFRQALLFLGLFSMVTAVVFLARQSDFKRMLAYSSIEHAGIIAIGLGLGKGALFGALLHLFNQGLTKGVLFLSAGNLHRAYGGKNIDQVRGALRRFPWTGGLFLVGFIAVTGSPPFAIFISQYTIVSGAFQQQAYLVGGALLLLMAAVFTGMVLTVLPMLLGPAESDGASDHYRNNRAMIGAPLLLAILLLVGGLWLPEPLLGLLRSGVALLGGEP